MRLPRSVLLGALAARHGGALDPGLAAHRITEVRRLEDAAEGELAPLLSRRFVGAARRSPALLLVDEALAPLLPAGRRWAHPHAAWTLAAVLEGIAAARARAPGRARVHATARVAKTAVILAGAVVGPAACIEPRAVVYGGVVIGARVVVGAGAVVGRPGFGWVTGPDGALARMPQLGGVLLEDDVEIGPLCTVDAGTLGPTVVRRGAKLDAQVHVGHNVEIGAGSMVAAQSGFAGSVRVGAGVLVGGQAGVADHVTIGDGARIAARSGVIGDVQAGATVAGYPAVDHRRWLRATARALARPGRGSGPRGAKRS